MKIAFVTIGFKPFRTSGLDISGERLVEGMLAQGHQVTVIAGRKGLLDEGLRHPSLRIVRVPLDPTDWIGFGYKAARTVAANEPFDVVHFWDVHFGWAYFGPYVASIQHSFHQRLLSLQGDPGSPIKRLYRYIYYSAARYLFEIPAMKRAKGLLAGSATTREEFVRNYVVKPDRIHLARHGIDTRFFGPRPEAVQLRQELGLPPNQPVIIFAGFITPRKGLEYLAQALPQIHPRPMLLLIGRWRNDGYRQRVMRLFGPCREAVIETGFVPDEQMPVYLSLADVYVSSSLLEGFGLPIAEALACETPVVAGRGGAIAEVMGPGGILIPPQDPQALSEAISNLLQDPLLRKDLAQRGRKHVQENFSLEKMLADTLQAYQFFNGFGESHVN
jgi:glycosyltransferase involved in cell wall biosynthesis